MAAAVTVDLSFEGASESKADASSRLRAPRGRAGGRWRSDARPGCPRPSGGANKARTPPARARRQAAAPSADAGLGRAARLAGRERRAGRLRRLPRRRLRRRLRARASRAAAR